MNSWDGGQNKKNFYFYLFFFSGNNLQWYNNEKSESSQANLLGSKWLCTIDESFKSDDSAKGHSQSLVSSESDIFPGKGGVLNNFNETFTRPQTLYKSSSSSQIPTGKGNSIQSNKQLKFGGTGTAKPISVISVPQSYVPHAIGKSYCCCAGNCCRKTVSDHLNVGVNQNKVKGTRLNELIFPEQNRIQFEFDGRRGNSGRVVVEKVTHVEGKAQSNGNDVRASFRFCNGE